MKVDGIRTWVEQTRSQLARATDTAISETWPRLWQAVIAPKSDPALDAAIAEKAAAHAPVVWLVGKVQSGKSSIVRTLTGSTAAEVGSGFKACTRTAMVFDFPAEAPVIRFLDTRGLGEAAYDASEDIAFGEGQAHLILAVMRAIDPDQSLVLDVLKAARQRHPDWPIVVAQTCLHEGYRAGQGHVLPYPFTAGLDVPTSAAIPADLARSLGHQRALFAGLPGTGPVLFAAVDFTRDDDGFTPVDYGREALVAALEAAAPMGMAASLAGPDAAREQRSEPHIRGYAAAAAAADIVPLAGAVAVPAIQAKMLHSLALIHGVEWDRQVIGEFSACLGTGTAARIAASLGLRQLAKLIPVYGQTVGAAAAAATSFATTMALGKAALYFLKRKRAGISDPDGVAAAYSTALKAAFRSQASANPTAPS